MESNTAKISPGQAHPAYSGIYRPCSSQRRFGAEKGPRDPSVGVLGFREELSRSGHTGDLFGGVQQDFGRDIGFFVDPFQDAAQFGL